MNVLKRADPETDQGGAPVVIIIIVFFSTKLRNTNFLQLQNF